MTEVEQFEDMSKDESEGDARTSLDFSRVIFQSIPICLRHIPTKDLKAK